MSLEALTVGSSANRITLLLAGKLKPQTSNLLDKWYKKLHVSLSPTQYLPIYALSWSRVSPGGITVGMPGMTVFWSGVSLLQRLFFLAFFWPKSTARNTACRWNITRCTPALPPFTALMEPVYFEIKCRRTATWWSRFCSFGLYQLLLSHVLRFRKRQSVMDGLDEVYVWKRGNALLPIKHTVRQRAVVSPDFTINPR